MKALSIRQPWASLIIQGDKPVENRTWKSSYCGPLLIHAAKTWDDDGEAWILKNFPHLKKNFEKAKELRGGVIGSVTMSSCVLFHPSRWFSGPYGFVFKNPQPLEFRPCPGKLNFFELPIELPVKSVPTQLELFNPQGLK